MSVLQNFPNLQLLYSITVASVLSINRIKSTGRLAKKTTLLFIEPIRKHSKKFAFHDKILVDYFQICTLIGQLNQYIVSLTNQKLCWKGQQCSEVN